MKVDLPDAPESFDVPHRSIMSLVSDEILMAKSSTTLRAAATLLTNASVGCMAIGERVAVEGVVSERDIVEAVASGVDLDATTVADIETKALKWATPDSTIDDVAAEMMESYVRHMLIGEDKTLVGLVSMRDVLSAYLD
jgi:CBS domain-containing protein